MADYYGAAVPDIPVCTVHPYVQLLHMPRSHIRTSRLTLFPYNLHSLHLPLQLSHNRVEAGVAPNHQETSTRWHLDQVVTRLWRAKLSCITRPPCSQASCTPPHLLSCPPRQSIPPLVILHPTCHISLFYLFFDSNHCHLVRGGMWILDYITAACGIVHCITCMRCMRNILCTCVWKQWTMYKVNKYLNSRLLQVVKTSKVYIMTTSVPMMAMLACQRSVPGSHWTNGQRHNNSMHFKFTIYRVKVWPWNHHFFVSTTRLPWWFLTTGHWKWKTATVASKLVNQH